MVSTVKQNSYHTAISHLTTCKELLSLANCQLKHKMPQQHNIMPKLQVLIMNKDRNTHFNTSFFHFSSKALVRKRQHIISNYFTLFWVTKPLLPSSHNGNLLPGKVPPSKLLLGSLSVRHLHHLWRCLSCLFITTKKSKKPLVNT